MRIAAAAILLFGPLIFAGLAAVPLRAAPIEAIGAERCGGPVQRLEVEFLAPETAQIEARVKVLRAGDDERSPASRLTIDGKPCDNARCVFAASKGTTYRFVAEPGTTGFDDLCVSVGRP